MCLLETVMQVRNGRLLLALLPCLALLVGGCDWGIGNRSGLVVNSTRRDLLVEVVGASEVDRLEVPAQTSRGASAFGECLGTGVNLYLSDGELLATLDRRICSGETLRIEDEDLRPSALHRELDVG
jgi:hypothetical protein